MQLVPIISSLMKGKEFIPAPVKYIPAVFNRLFSLYVLYFLIKYTDSHPIIAPNANGAHIIILSIFH